MLERALATSPRRRRRRRRKRRRRIEGLLRCDRSRCHQ